MLSVGKEYRQTLLSALYEKVGFTGGDLSLVGRFHVEEM